MFGFTLAGRESGHMRLPLSAAAVWGKPFLTDHILLLESSVSAVGPASLPSTSFQKAQTHTLCWVFCLFVPYTSSLFGTVVLID